MRKQMYSLLDHTAQVFLNPLQFTNDGDAIRWFGTQVNTENKDNMIHVHPEQFTLFRLADYDDKLGTYHPRDVENNGDPSQEPKQLITGIQVQEDQVKKFTVKDLVSMLKYELQKDNVIDFQKHEKNK